MKPNASLKSLNLNCFTIASLPDGSSDHPACNNGDKSRCLSSSVSFSFILLLEGLLLLLDILRSVRDVKDDAMMRIDLKEEADAIESRKQLVVLIITMELVATVTCDAGGCASAESITRRYWMVNRSMMLSCWACLCQGEKILRNCEELTCTHVVASPAGETGERQMAESSSLRRSELNEDHQRKKHGSSLGHKLTDH